MGSGTSFLEDQGRQGSVSDLIFEESLEDGKAPIQDFCRGNYLLCIEKILLLCFLQLRKGMTMVLAPWVQISALLFTG